MVSLESFSMALMICSMGVMPGGRGERRGRREEGEKGVRVIISKLPHDNMTE